MSVIDPSSGEIVGIADKVREGIDKRKRAEVFYKAYGIIAITVAVCFLLFLLSTIARNAYPAFTQTHALVTVNFAEDLIAPVGTTDEQEILRGKWRQIGKETIVNRFGIDADDRAQLRAAREMMTNFLHFELRDMAVKDPSLIGQTVDVWMPTGSNIDQFIKGEISRETPSDQRLISDLQIEWADQLVEAGEMERRFNAFLFLRGASSTPEMAGLLVALIGSAYMMGIVLLLSVPLGVAAAIFLEEFAPKNAFVDLIEVNINNLAAVPSIVFGILGLSLFINFMGLPRGAPIVGGLVLTLMTLPTIIIATRASLRAVPPSIREAALGVGASKTQAIFHHVLPLAAPGILTGTIIGLAQALGETAPLLMLGLLAFVVEVPSSPFDTATALPVQIFLWSTYAERGFVERTSAAIVVLLVFMIAMNLLAIVLRRRFERRW